MFGIRHPYDVAIPVYDAAFKLLNPGLRDACLRMCRPSEGLRVLDLACGTGVQLGPYVSAGAEAVGIDASLAMIRKARRALGPDVTLLLGDAARLPVPDASFHVVLVTMALHEMPVAARSRVVHEARRVLRESGVLLLVDYCPGPLRWPDGWIKRAAYVVAELLAGPQHFRRFRQFLKTGGLPAAFARQGLVVEESRVLRGGNVALFLLRVRRG